MTAHEFLKTLETELQKRGVDKVDEILADYREHFEHAKRTGKDEATIAAKLGNPITIAKGYEVEKEAGKMTDPDAQFQFGKALSMIGRLILIAPFNLIILFIPGMIIFGLISAAWGISIGMGGVGIGLFGILFEVTKLSSAWATVSVLSAALAAIAATVFAVMASFGLTKYVMLAVIDYLKWNLKFVTEK